MNIIAVDDEAMALSLLEGAIRQALPNERPACFSNGGDALAYAKRVSVDVAFLDMKMNAMNGLVLAKALAAIRPTTNVIFVTGHLDYMEQAYEQYASGYVKKPVQAKRILKEIANLRYPLGEQAEERRVKVLGPYMLDYVTQRVYWDGRDALLTPREFRLFALLAANLGLCFTGEALFAKLWGDDPAGSIDTVKVHMSSLRKKLGLGGEQAFSIQMRRGQGYCLVRTD